MPTRPSLPDDNIFYMLSELMLALLVLKLVVGAVMLLFCRM